MSTNAKPAAAPSADSWFIDPGAIVRLPLEGIPPQADGTPHWIEVKRELSFAEENVLMGSMTDGFRTNGNGTGPAMGVDFARFQVERFATWIVDWSARTANGKPAPLNRDAIKNLRPVLAAAIDAALDAHVENAGKVAPPPTPS